MRAAEIRRLSDQCAILARTKPAPEAPFEEREAWWKAVRALRVGPLTMEPFTTEVLLEADERAALRDALVHIDEGKNFKNSTPDAGQCVPGLECAEKLLGVLAGRMRSGKSTSEMVAELFREAGVLTMVFGVLDGVLHGVARHTAAVVLAVGVILTALGFWLERARR